LVLEDGEVFQGEAFGAEQDAFGEVVFNTSMSGYQEVLTDPSYKGQIVAMTYPHIGNYGVNDEDPESGRVWVNGFVIRDLPPRWSNWRGATSLEGYLASHGVAGITEVDTRRLTRHIREKGAMRGVISSGAAGPASLAGMAGSQPGISEADLVSEVTTGEPYVWPADDEVRFRVAAWDFGIKRNIMRHLAARGVETTIFPARTSGAELIAHGPDGLLLSNGPGDPESVDYGITQIRNLLARIPVFGICLGHQLLALSVGLETYKLRFGHHGANHPVRNLITGHNEITTQNHGFAVVEGPFGFSPGTATFTRSAGSARSKHAGRRVLVPADWKLEDSDSLARPDWPKGPGHVAGTDFGKAELTHMNLNDGTIEGFRMLEVPAFCVQYHPEAGPGPHDSGYLFESFLELMRD
jgi:carbamoyl-phosphate synthase small subunit